MIKDPLAEMLAGLFIILHLGAALTPLQLSAELGDG